jgi:hypothetical protein
MREARRSDGQRKLEEDEAERAERSKAGRDSGGGPDRICPLSLDRFVGGCQWQHECTSAESEARSQRRARGVREDLTPTRLDESGTGAWCHFAGETCVQRLHAPVYRTCVLAGAQVSWRAPGVEPEARAAGVREDLTPTSRVQEPGATSRGKCVCNNFTNRCRERVCARSQKPGSREYRYTQSHHDRRPAGENRYGDTNDDRCGENILVWVTPSGTLFTVNGVLHSHTYGDLLDVTKGLIHTVCMRLRCSAWRRSVCSACGCAHVCGHSSRWLRVFS